MFKFLKKSCSPKRVADAAGAAATVHPATPPLVRPDGFDEYRYPPVDPGLPAATIHAVVRSQHDLIERLRLAVVSRAEPFESYYLRPIEAVARYVHLLPASGYEHFAGPGGLFRFCIEMAFYCRQAADGRVFVPDGPVESRHSLEPRWRYAAFLSGLLCEIYRPLSAVIVTDTRGRPWPKFLESLEAWLDTHCVDRYFVYWQSATSAVGSGAEGAAILGEIVPREQLAWLNAGSPAIVRDVFSTALGQTGTGESVLSDMVQTIRERVLQAEVLTRRSRYGRLRLGHHLEPHLLDALRSRLASGEWALHNGSEGPFWFGTDGLYLAWPISAESLRLHAQGLGLPGVPTSAFTLAELLGQAGLLVPSGSNDWLWTLRVNDPVPGEPAVYKTALRFRQPGALLGYMSATCLPRPFAVEPVSNEFAETWQGGPGGICVPALDSHSLIPTDSVAAGARVPAPVEPPSPGRPSSCRTGTHPLADAQAVAVTMAQAQAPAAGQASNPLGGSTFTRHADLFAQWLALHQAAAGHLVGMFPDGRIAVSEEWLAQHAMDLSSTVADMERHGWLGRGDWQGRATRVGMLPFADGPKLGFVINASAARAWGFL